MKDGFIIIAIVLIFSAAALAQSSITGKWQGETRNGSQIIMDLTVTDGALTGALTVNGQATRIFEGKVSKDNFTFKATLGNQTEGFTGEVLSDEMTLWMDRQGRPGAAVLKRVKN